MPLPCQRRQRGPYATKACTNCKQKHIRCSGNAPCNHCKLHNLECIFINSGKRRGPKTKSTLSSVSNVQDHVSVNTQQSNNNGDIIFYFIPYFVLQEPVPLLNQVLLDTDHLVQNNLLISDLYQNNHLISDLYQ
ncbi:61_t:CDS:1, partial [Scutellospora calospora]